MAERLREETDSLGLTYLVAEEFRSEYVIPDCNWASFSAKIEALNKRARKLGCPEIKVAKDLDHMAREAWQPQCPNIERFESDKLVWISESNWSHNQASMLPARATGRVMPFWKVTIDGEAPRYKGWKFVATLSPVEVEDAYENVIKNVPGEHCPEQFRHRPFECDHCQTKRRRNETFVVVNESGEHKAVGSTCLKDFLGHNDPHQLASWAELLAELGSCCSNGEDYDDYRGGGYVPPIYDLPFVLAVTSSLCRAFGWVSSTAAMNGFGTRSTRSLVSEYLNPPSAMAGADALDEWRKFRDEHEPNDADKAKAEAAIEWAKGLSEAELSDNNYLSNLNLIARAGQTKDKTMGYAVSMLVAHAKVLDREAELRRSRDKVESHHIGRVGERLELDVTCERVLSHEGMYGITGIHKLLDADGNDLTWFASESATWLDEGESYRVKATVKKHDEFRGSPQTIVNRVSIVKRKEV